MNACGHHHVGHIGILGVDKHGEEWYQITLGGSVERLYRARRSDRSLGAQGRGRRDARPIFSRSIGEERDSASESFLETVRRVGIEPFKERAYAADYIAA